VENQLRMVEIERKFLVLSEAFKDEAFTSNRIVQGFLNTHPNRTVRVRIKGNRGFLTVKGLSNEAGTIRTEWEKEIDVSEAETLLNLCEEGIIEKTRYEVQAGKHIFEVDEFFGKNQGLIIAEIELNAENESFEKPNWLGKEVTGDIKYYNSQLSNQPYNTWKL
jgi:adenylate cyclase